MIKQSHCSWGINYDCLECGWRGFDPEDASNHRCELTGEELEEREIERASEDAAVFGPDLYTAMGWDE